MWLTFISLGKNQNNDLSAGLTAGTHASSVKGTVTAGCPDVKDCKLQITPAGIKAFKFLSFMLLF